MMRFKKFYINYILEKNNTLDIDEEYLNAVNAGDMEMTQRMVDEAAKAAGLIEVFRAVRGEENPRLEARPGYMVTFSTRKEVADSYGQKDTDTTRYFIDPKIAEEYPSRNGNFSKTGFDRKVVNGNGWFVVKGVYDPGPYASLERDPNMMFSYSSDIYGTSRVDKGQIKSSDPVIYDDAGNIIPLSKRFNSKSDDI